MENTIMDTVLDTTIETTGVVKEATKGMSLKTKLIIAGSTVLVTACTLVAVKLLKKKNKNVDIEVDETETENA